MPCSPHQPHACSGCTAGRTYSAGLFPSPCAGCYTLLSEETPCHQVLDELIVSCWKGYVHFFFSLSRLAVTEWGSSWSPSSGPSLEKGVCHSQTEVRTDKGLFVLHLPSALPLLTPTSSSSLCLSENTQLPRKWKSEAEEKGMSCSWNYPCALVLLVLVTDYRIRNTYGNMQKIWEKSDTL